MKGKKFNIPDDKPRVLVAPLDWGLGHATRCIPIIYELLANGCEVLIAAENPVKILLQKEFSQLAFLPLKGYNMQYSKSSSLLPLKLFTQFPKIIRVIYKEHHWLKKVVKEYKIDTVISDNRFGLYHSKIPCVYITHQLLIKTGNAFTERIAQRIHYYFIKKYSVCWVPDFEGAINIAGELSHPPIKLPGVVYLGGLSRFNRQGIAEKKYGIAIILSGPEPQRSIFENLLLLQLKDNKETILFVRGLPNAGEIKKASPPNICIVNHLSSAELSTAIQQAEIVISRSGYTTVMDLIKLQQKAIFVPTPGQTEQEYLAKHLAEQKIFLCFEQKSFSLVEAMNQSKDFPFNIAWFDMEQYKNVVHDFVLSITKP